MVSLKADLGAVFDRRMEERETRINELNEELNGLRQKVSVRKHVLQMLLFYATCYKIESMVVHI